MPKSIPTSDMPLSGPGTTRIPWRVAAPSFVRPAGIAENCDFLVRHVDEVGLCFFESEGSLAYDATDLPSRLARLDLRYHVHLPLDLQWTAPETDWKIIERLVEKAAFLSPEAYVLHPHEAAPPDEIAKRFKAMGIDPARVLLENIKGQPLTDIWPQIVESGLSVCLDTGHVLAYAQQPVLALPELWNHVAMVHLNAPDPKNPARHAGLPLMDQKGRQLLQHVLARLQASATVMIEVFDEPALMTSLNFFAAAAAAYGERR